MWQAVAKGRPMSKPPESKLPESRGASSWRDRAIYFTPVYPLRRAFGSMGQAGERIRQTFVALGHRMPARDSQGKAGDVGAIADDKDRFEEIYKANGWTERDLGEQVIACKRTRLTCVFLAAVSLAIAFTALFLAPIWTLIFILPIGGSTAILALAQAFKFALFETQIELRSLIDARTFYARDDLFARMFR